MTGNDRTQKISPLFNDVFLHVFGRQESKRLTLSLVNSILREAGLPELDGADTVAADSASPGGAILKSPRADVVVRCDNRFVDLESERRRVDVESKSLFYASGLLCANTPKGTDYERLPQVIVITLLDGRRMFPGGQVLTVGRMHWERRDGCLPGGDRMMFVVVELDKVRERYNDSIEEVLGDGCLCWLYLLAEGYRSDEEVERIVSSIGEIGDFSRQYGMALNDPDVKRAYDLYNEAEMEYNSMIAFDKREAREAGLAEGLAEGRAAGLAEGRAEGREAGLAEGREAGLAEGRAEGREAGLAEGREAGLAEGREAGVEEGKAAMAESLLALGVDERLIRQALAQQP